MSFEFTCPHCGKKLEAETEWIGSKGQCPSCNREITITIDQDHSNTINEEKENTFLYTKEYNKQDNSKKQHLQSEHKSPLHFYKIVICGCIIIIIILCVLVFLLYHKYQSNTSINNNQVVEIKQTKNNTTTETTSKKNDYHSISINCYLYNDFNEKKIPSCEIRLYTSCIDAEDTFTALHVGKVKIDKAQEEHEKWKEQNDSSINLKMSNYIMALLKAQLDTLNELADILSKENIVKEGFFREGHLDLDNIPNGEYTLSATATYGKQNFIWIKHIKINNKNIEIDLTNDPSCLIN